LDQRLDANEAVASRADDMPHHRRLTLFEYLLRERIIPARESVRGPDGFRIAVMAGGTLVGWLIDWLR
jgi:hypothetical protein